MKHIFDKIYVKRGKGPWTLEEPPKEIVEVVSKVKPCKALDIGCGEGFFSIYLAKQGFDVTGIDYSEVAVERAKENAKKAGVKIDFRVMDVKDVKERFDFALEWSFLHCLTVEEALEHPKHMANILNPGAIYLATCFNIQGTKFGEPGIKFRSAGPENLQLVFYSLQEVIDMYSPYFDILESKVFIFPMANVSGDNPANWLLMKRK